MQHHNHYISLWCSNEANSANQHLIIANGPLLKLVLAIYFSTLLVRVKFK